jgi:succinate dehydrogenase / fumarate reductase cytochrome b subunit
MSLRGPKGFEQAVMVLESTWVKLGLLLFLWALIHHLLAGIRFLLIDFDIGIRLQPARLSARVTSLVAPVVAFVCWLVLI